MLNPDPESAIVFCRGSLTFVQAQLGRIAHTAGDLEGAIAHFEAAQRDCRAARYGPELAWICYDHAGALLDARRPGDADRAARHLDEGAELADRHGMPPLSAKIAELKSTVARPSPPGGLTPREIDVLVLLARGKTNKEIATELFIAERTASNHVSNILAKIKCGNRVEAAAFAHRQGLVRP
jgi:DNA-binding CsgD family transcriptional regulator